MDPFVKEFFERKIIVVCRGSPEEKIVKVASALYDGGIRFMEVPFNQADKSSYAATAAKIKAVKEAVSVPIIGNGDIFCAADAEKMVRETGCDGIAVARGALGNPWLFEEIHLGADFVPPSKQERIREALRHFRFMMEEKGERVAVAESRAAIAYYTKGLSGSSRIRGTMNFATTADEIISILSAYAESEN